MPPEPKHPFIVVEGPDGAGKSTLVERLTRAFDRTVTVPHKTFKTAQPAGVDRHDLAEAQNEEQRLFMFLADRAMHVDGILKPLLRQGIVFCDRYTDSTLVYNGAVIRSKGGDQVWGRIIGACYLAERGLVPDLTIFLDVSADKAIARIAERGENDENDRLDTEERRARFERRRLDYARCYETGRKTVAWIETTAKSEDEVFRAACAVVSGFLLDWYGKQQASASGGPEQGALPEG